MSDSKLVTMAPHLWELLERMSLEMGVSMDALVAQAIFALGRQHGYPVSSLQSPPTLVMQQEAGTVIDKQEDMLEPQGNAPKTQPLALATEAAPEPTPGAILTLFVEGQQPVQITGDSFTIGRGRHCDFSLNSNRVSRAHARVLREGAVFFLEDLHSSNGTLYGGTFAGVTRQQIQDGDEFILGNQKISFRIHNPIQTSP